MRKVLYLNIGTGGLRLKQKKVFTRRWKKEFERNNLQVQADRIGWYPILKKNNDWERFKRKYGDNEILIMYYPPENRISNEIYKKVGQTKYAAGEAYFSEMQNMLFQIHETISDLPKINFLNTPEAYLSDKNKDANYRLFTEQDIPTPPTKKVNSPEEAFKFIEEYKDIYLKPLASSFGRGITRITKYDEKYLVATKLNLENPANSIETITHSFSYSEQELYEWLNRFLEYVPLSQKAINSPILRYNENVEMVWDLRFVSICPQYYDKVLSAGIRAAPKQKIVTNLSAGGQEFSLESFVLKEDLECELNFGEKEFLKLKDATLKVANSKPFFEMGIDFIFNSQGEFFAIELNGAPGYKVGYFSGMTLGEYAIIGALVTKLGIEDIFPQLREITYEDMFLEFLRSLKEEAFAVHPQNK